MKKVILFCAWLIALVLILSVGYDLINLCSTVGNIMGFILLIAFALLSVETKCFTSTPKNQKQK